MSWKGTIVLAGLAVATFVAWFVLRPKEEVVVVRERPFNWKASAYESITVRAPDRPDLVLRRHGTPQMGSVWHLDQPARPADDVRIQEMIDALNRLSRDRSIKPGEADHTPATYGLDKPVATVEVSAAGGEKRTVKFGNPSTRLADVRFFMIEGDPEIYYGPVDAVPPFLRPVAELRSRQFIAYDPARVVRVEVSKKYLRAGSDKKPGLSTEYEKMKFEFREQPGSGLKGWYLTSINDEPRNEKAEDARVAHLITGLRDLRSEEYVPVEKPEELGFKEPEAVIRLDILQPPGSATAPLVVEVGKTRDDRNRKLTYVRVDGGGEAGVVSAPMVERIPLERKQFVSLNLVDFDPALLESVELVTDTGHRVKLERNQDRWIVTAPKDLPYEQASADDFVRGMMRLGFADILGEQPDLASFGLDKPALTMTLRIKPKNGPAEDRVYRMGRPGDATTAYVLKPGSKEVYQLADEIWKRFDKTDLNFRKMKMFDVPVAAIVGVSFSYRQDHLNAGVQFAVRRGEGGKWEFEDAALRDKTRIDQTQMEAILQQVNWIAAERFITRSPRAAKDFEDPMGRLTVRYADPANPGKAAEKSFRISKSYADSTGTARFYYAKMEPAPGDGPSSDSTIIFQIKTETIERLRRGVVQEEKAPY